LRMRKTYKHPCQCNNRNDNKRRQVPVLHTITVVRAVSRVKNVIFAL
jgi:hypothetical protein